jgi:hypothetical protein
VHGNRILSRIEEAKARKAETRRRTLDERQARRRTWLTVVVPTLALLLSFAQAIIIYRDRDLAFRGTVYAQQIDSASRLIEAAYAYETAFLKFAAIPRDVRDDADLERQRQLAIRDGLQDIYDGIGEIERGVYSGLMILPAPVLDAAYGMRDRAYELAAIGNQYQVSVPDGAVGPFDQSIYDLITAARTHFGVDALAVEDLVAPAAD